jgi:peptide/nickel transport system permease protein
MASTPTAPALDPRAAIERGAAARVGQSFRENPVLLVGALMSLAIVATALLAPVMAPFPEDAGSATHPLQTLQPPSADHPFGTDQVGRDILSRVVMGARVSPVIAALVLVIACLVGIPLGLAAG